MRAVDAETSEPMLCGWRREGISMALDDDDITTSGTGGEGPADGGSNPEGRDGGADGTA